MSQDQQQPKLPQEAVIKSVTKVSKIWIIPIVALFIGMWMMFYQWSNQGKLINIEFKTATGLVPGKTRIKTRDVDIGLVKSIELAEDLNAVIVTARLDKNVSPLLHADNQFWIVSPRVSLSGISGLGTILSGPYINMVPGVETKSSDQFVALEAPPVTPTGTPGLHVTLNSKYEFAYKKGDPVIYKGIKVGEFEYIHFNFEERIVYYNTFIQAPYHKLITTNTKFWDVSGIQMKLGASGLKVSSGSLETLLTNGVTFAVPDGMPRGELITERNFFDIHADYESASEQRYKLSAEFIIYIKDSVRGLQVGAPVEYRGLVIGKVLSINSVESKQLGLLEDGYDIPVTISIQPGRVQQPDNQQGLEFIRQQTSLWIERGLRATLKTGNFLTGALFVELQHHADLPKVEASFSHGYQVIPSVSNEFSEITSKVSAILDNINEIKFKAISENADELLVKISQAAQALETTANATSHVMDSMQQDQVTQVMADALKNLSKLSQDYSADSDTYKELNQTMRSLQITLKELQPLLMQLNNAPNSLIFSPPINNRPVPKAKSSATKNGAR